MPGQAWNVDVIALFEERLPQLAELAWARRQPVQQDDGTRGLMPVAEQYR